MKLSEHPLWAALLAPIWFWSQIVGATPLWVTSGAVGGLTTNAVNHAVFNGSQYLRVSSASPSGLADGTTGTMSCWIKFDPAMDGAAAYIFSLGQGANETFMFAKRATNTLVIRGFDEFTNKDMDLETTSTWTSANGWIQVMACWDLSSTSLRKLYVNGVSQSLTATVYETTPGSNVLNYFTSSGTRVSIGCNTADTAAILFKGGLAELWWNDSYNDVIGDYYSGGNAVPLGTNGELPLSGTSPVFYYSGAGTGASWTTNSGTGGALTINTGSLTTDANPPQLP